MTYLVVAHFAAALVAIPVARRLGGKAFLLAAAVPAATALWSLTVLSRSASTTSPGEVHAWIKGLDVDLSFQAGGLSALMAFLIGGIGVLVFLYSYRYFDPAGPEVVRVCSLLLAFAGSMLGLVLADGFFTLFLFWEATSVTSFFLIGTEFKHAAARAAATQALLITGLGGIAMLVGFTIFGASTGIWHLSGVENAGSQTLTGLPAVALVLIATGCLAKSAQLPFGSWLPAAMAAPTPVSAFLHSATMVKAGVYLIARLSPVLGGGPWRALVIGSAGLTMVLAGWRALRQDDLKLLLAHSTVAQLGLLCFLFAMPDRRAWVAGVVLLLAHALSKAGLFMGVGIIDHSLHTRDISRLDRLASEMRGVAAVMSAGFACMAGVPLTLAFAGKERGLENLMEISPPWFYAAIGLMVVASALTAAYSTYALRGAFFTSAKGDVAVLGRRPSLGFVIPAGVLTFAGIAMALFAKAPEMLLGSAVKGATGKANFGIPVLPHVGSALVISLLALACGVGFGYFDRLRHFASKAALPFPLGQRVYEAINVGLIRFADRLAGVVQSGSLPIYVATITIVGMGLIAWYLAAIDIDLGALPLAGSVVELLLVAACGVLAAAMAVQRSRVTAVLLLGGVGYGLAAVFVVLGAPDLALTQVVIETLAVVVFLLVVKDQPAKFGRTRPVGSEVLKIAAAAFAGVVVFVLLAGSEGYRADHFVSAEIVEFSVADAGAQNVVNAILVDFRALDTMGEILVLTIAVIGAATLAGIETRRRGRA
ncbi:MAG: hypothetical protein DCC49_03265 [Acidobacteria bacterium]|nr:MAG: hypothetical protein DCC49_03265 [Acidobacteriota bacterium]